MRSDLAKNLRAVTSVMRVVDLSAAAVFWIVAVIAFVCFLGYGVYVAAHNLNF
jgi:hypothetical protein